MFVDEAAYIEAGVYSKIIAILQTLHNCSVVCITTPEGTPNAYFSSLINKPRYGAPHRTLFKQQNVVLVCDNCKLRGVTTECIHAKGLAPFWIESIRQKYAALFQTDEGDTYREIYGVMVNDTPYCFSEPKLKEIWDSPPVQIYGVPKHIFISIDTNSGKFKTSTKSTSKFALLSGADNRDHFVIIGIENIDANIPDHYTPALINHMRILERRFPHSQLVVIVDGMLGMDGGVIQREFNRHSVKNVIFVSTGTEKPGVIITDAVKRDYMITMNDAINSNQIAFTENLITSHKNLSKLKEEFLDQMCKYSQLKDIPDEPHKPISIHFTGKLVKGMCDDLCVTFQQLLYYKRYFLFSDKYKRYRV